jgi:hypothetical protein
VKLSVKNPSVTGSVRNLNALNPNVNWSVKTLTVEPRLNAVLVMLVVLQSTLVCPSSKKVKRMTSVVLAKNE